MSNAGAILRVDLTTSKVEKEPTSAYIRNYVGGLSIGTKLLWDAVPADVPALDPRNMLIFCTGPLTGTLLGNKSVLVSKSPLMINYPMGNAGMGGQFPSEMKFAGYDHIAVTGRSEEPVYLFINNEEVEIRDAKHLWGLDVADTQERIKRELRDPDVQIAAIGPAGENTVAFANVLHDIAHSASRVGHGAVMGSKRLKAVAVRGTKGLRIADPQAFLALWEQYWKYYTEGRGQFTSRILNREGVSVHYDLYVPQDMMVWGNFDSFVVPPRRKEEHITDFIEKYAVGRIGCAFCPVQCHDNYDCDGIGAGGTCMWYTGFRYAVKNMDLKVFWRVGTLSQRYGMDALCTTGITAWLMDLYEQGIINAADTDGIPMEWGSEEAMTAVVEKIARREGFGEILADGVLPAARRIGKNAVKHAVQYRNMNIHPGFSPIDASAGINMIPGASEVWNHPPGGDFYAIYPLYSQELGISDEEARQLAADWLSDFAEKSTGDRDSWREENYEKYADYIVVNETAISACDIAGHCDWMSDRVPQAGMWWGPAEVAQAVTAATGTSTTRDMIVNAHRRRRLLELTYCKLCERAFGERDEMPLKLMKPRPDGKFKGQAFNLGKLPVTVNRYFELMGIDPETQLPKRAELERLGLKDVADRLDGLDHKEKPAPPG